MHSPTDPQETGDHVGGSSDVGDGSWQVPTMPNQGWIDMKYLNLNEWAPVQCFDLASDTCASGEVSGKYQPTKPFEFYEVGATLSWEPPRNELAH